MADSQLLAILLIAMVAGVILFRLYTVLGRRTGNERQPQDRLGRAAGAALPPPAEQATAAGRVTGQQGDGPAAGGLLEIKLADSKFETDRFLDGARSAFKMIGTAFAARDRETLRPLLSAEVYSTFDSAMKEREARGETVGYSFVGFKGVRIVHAALKGATAEITVEFSAQFTSVTTGAKGEVVEGDPKAVRDVVDVWTFARDIHANDPNWTLVATAGAD